MNQNKNTFSKIDKAVGVMSRVCVIIASLSIVGIVITVVVHTIDRKYFHLLGWIFVDEWSGYLFVLIVFFSLALTLRSGDKHIRVSLMRRFVGRRAWSVMGIVTLLLTVPVLIFMTYSATSRLLSMLEGGIRNNTPLMTPMWIPYTFIVVGLGVFTLAVVAHVIGKIIYATTVGEQGTDDEALGSEIGG